MLPGSQDRCFCVAGLTRSLCFCCQAHEIVALEILFLLIQNPTDDSVELAVAFLQEVGQKLAELSPKAIVGKWLVLHQV